jgi:hypothetical protein
MGKTIRVCIGYATPAQDKPRYQVMDECGPLRIFWTKEEAQRWMLPWMKLVVLPKPKREKQYLELEEALL